MPTVTRAASGFVSKARQEKEKQMPSCRPSCGRNVDFADRSDRREVGSGVGGFYG